MKKLLFMTMLLLCVLRMQAQEQRPVVTLLTDSGTIKIALYNETPLHRDNFLKLVREGFYDGVEVRGEVGGGEGGFNVVADLDGVVQLATVVVDTNPVGAGIGDVDGSAGCTCGPQVLQALTLSCLKTG